MSFGKEDAGRTVQVSVDKYELPTRVTLMIVLEPMLPDRQSEAATNPTPIAGDFSGPEEYLVRNVEMRQMRRSSAMVAMITQQKEIRLVHPALSLNLGDHLSD